MADIPRIPDIVEVDERSAMVDNVDFRERIITVIACPYEQPTQVLYHDEAWNEIVSRSAFAGIQRKNKIRVNREHDRVLTVGKVTGYYPDRAEGLVIDTYIAQTPLGQETLELARDGILDGSVGMKVATSDQTLDRRNRTRRINRAFLDHFAFTADPAYEGAQVISVRNHEAAALARAAAPGIADYYSDPLFRWADERLAEERADTAYADPKNGKYPIDTMEHARAALSYFSMPKNHAAYSAEEITAIMGRIHAACKKFGIEVA